MDVMSIFPPHLALSVSLNARIFLFPPSFFRLELLDYTSSSSKFQYIISKVL